MSAFLDALKTGACLALMLVFALWLCAMVSRWDR